MITEIKITGFGEKSNGKGHFRAFFLLWSWVWSFLRLLLLESSAEHAAGGVDVLALSESEGCLDVAFGEDGEELFGLLGGRGRVVWVVGVGGDEVDLGVKVAGDVGEGVGVVVRAKHLCMMMRGVEKQNSEMTTSAVLGSFRSDEKVRQEFLSLIR